MAVYQAIEKWGIIDESRVLCFDRTTRNTGRINVANTNIENLFNRDLLYFPSLSSPF